MVRRPPELPLPTPIPGMLPPELPVSSVRDPKIARIVAISRVLAAQARAGGGVPELGLRDVMAFRARHLPGGRLLDPEAVESWVTTQATQDGAPDRTFVIAVHAEDIKEVIEPDAGDTRRAAYLLGHDGRALHVAPLQLLPSPYSRRQQPGWLELAYATPWAYAARVPVRAGGTLDALRRLAERLADGTQWSPALAATFALTGLIPYADRFAANLEHQRGRRSREMTLKHLELAVFTAEHEGESLAARLAEWNATYPDWPYTTVQHFGGDSRLAVRRLVEEGAWTGRSTRGRLDEDAGEEGASPDDDE